MSKFTRTNYLQLKLYRTLSALVEMVCYHCSEVSPDLFHDNCVSVNGEAIDLLVELGVATQPNKKMQQYRIDSEQIERLQKEIQRLTDLKINHNPGSRKPR